MSAGVHTWMSTPNAGRQSTVSPYLLVSSRIDDHTAENRRCGHPDIGGRGDGDQKRRAPLRPRRPAFTGKVNREMYAEEPYSLFAVGARHALRIFVIHAAHDAEGDKQKEQDKHDLGCGHDLLLE